MKKEYIAFFKVKDRVMEEPFTSFHKWDTPGNRRDAEKMIHKRYGIHAVLLAVYKDKRRG